ncbi:hypothetical protein [Micromonospora aurantiaca]|uniref:hypothetical protein n=1 Tax=Micromonospora aurantiaca (nom. illeg.) TaxID=47850 RepID=UPI00345538AD
MDTDRLGICLDLAHLACGWEQPAEALAGLPAVEVPVTAAVEAPDPAGPVPREALTTSPAGMAAGPPFARDQLTALGPVLLCSGRAAIRPRAEATDVKALLLELAGPAWEAP